MRFAINSPAHRPFDESNSTLRIVRAAKRVFLRTGGSKMSIRHVAREASMSVGAVQHFYRKREQLVAAMLEYVVNEYEAAYERVFRKLPFNGEARLLGLIHYLTTDILRQATRQFFFALWALSSHNRFAERLMEEMYQHHRRNLAAFIGAARPGLSERECFDAAMQIAATIEGLMIFTAPRNRHPRSRKELARMVQSSVLKLLAGTAQGRPLAAIRRTRRRKHGRKRASSPANRSARANASSRTSDPLRARGGRRSSVSQRRVR